MKIMLPHYGDADAPIPTHFQPRQVGRRRFRSWARRHKRGLWVTATLITLTILTLGVLAGTVLYRFSANAAVYDLTILEERPKGSSVTDLNGGEIGAIFVKDQSYVTYQQLPAHLVDAVVAVEDSRFFDHDGYDLKGMARAAFVNLTSGEVQQGGSTITQQLARNAFGLEGRTYSRKLTEIFLAKRIEETFTKEEILEHYLNQIYFGGGFYGVSSAASGYFGKDVSTLTVEESALLAGIIKRPTYYSPYVRPDLARQARAVALYRMASMGFITEVKAEAASQSPLGILDEKDRSVDHQYVLNEVKKQARALVGDAHVGGSTIQTSLHLRLQDAAQDILERGLARIESQEGYAHMTYADFKERRAQGESVRPDYLQGAVMILENRTGRILAAVGGRNYTDSQFNRAFDARRPAGSSFVPFVYAAAFENGSVNPATPLIDAPMNNRHVMIGGTMGVLGEWGAENLSNTYEGKIPAAYSLVEGKNAATVRLGNEVGLDAVKDFARRVGFKSQLRDYPSTYLGESEVTLAEMVRAFAVFPNQGLLCPEPHLIIDVQGNRSTLDYLEDSPASEQVISPLAAAQTTALLQASLQYGTASDVVNRHQLNPIGLAGKTGTAYGSTDCWFVGFNSEVTVGVWVGFDHPKSIGSHAFSRDLALPIWADLMASLPPARPFPNVDGITPEPICLKCGDLAVPGCPTKIRLPFSAEQRKHLKTCTEHAKLAMPVETTAPVLEPSSPQPAVALQPIPVRAQVLIGQDPYSNTQ